MPIPWRTRRKRYLRVVEEKEERGEQLRGGGSGTERPIVPYLTGEAGGGVYHPGGRKLEEGGGRYSLGRNVF